MTVAQSEKMFREQAFQDPGNARQQAARGTYDPAYLNYTLGKLMIRKLRTDWLAKRPGTAPGADDRARWHEFHDKFLSYGGPPIPLLRKEMVGRGRQPDCEMIATMIPLSAQAPRSLRRQRESPPSAANGSRLRKSAEAARRAARHQAPLLHRVHRAEVILQVLPP